ncbi:MAG: hypothetical protein OEZ43_11120 [Gammaproteobacteria bacterium]|nr:hypothetical protein [Gammaproteobacteria bacterium]
MPYYVFKYENSEMARLQPMELLEQFDAFKEASNYAKTKRAELESTSNMIIKVMFGENQVSAEEQLREKRDPRPTGEE